MQVTHIIFFNVRYGFNSVKLNILYACCSYCTEILVCIYVVKGHFQKARVHSGLRLFQILECVLQDYLLRVNFIWEMKAQRKICQRVTACRNGITSQEWHQTGNPAVNRNKSSPRPSLVLTAFNYTRAQVSGQHTRKGDELTCQPLGFIESSCLSDIWKCDSWLSEVREYRGR